MNSFLEPAGAIQRSPENVEQIAPLRPRLGMSAQEGLCQADEGLVIGDRVGGHHTGPEEAVGLCGVGHIVKPPERLPYRTPHDSEHGLPLPRRRDWHACQMRNLGGPPSRSPAAATTVGVRFLPGKLR